MDRSINVTGRLVYKVPADLTRVTLDIDPEDVTFNETVDAV